MADTLREALESARDGFINLRPAWDENPGMRRQIDAHIIRIDNVLSSPQAPDRSDEARAEPVACIRFWPNAAPSVDWLVPAERLPEDRALLYATPVEARGEPFDHAHPDSWKYEAKCHPTESNAETPTRAAIQDLCDLLRRALPIIQSDAQMMADITRHSPLDPESQAVHDSTEYESEKLLREIPAAIAAALPEPSRSQKLRAAGFTRRPSPPGRMAGGLWKDPEDQTEHPSTAVQGSAIQDRAITARELAFALNYHGDDARIGDADDNVLNFSGTIPVERVRSTPAGLTDAQDAARWREILSDATLIQLAGHRDAESFAAAVDRNIIKRAAMEGKHG